jgi:type IV pilus assembly protein PilC
MITYQYKALNTKTGQHIRATIQADNEQNASKLLRKEGLVATDIQPIDAGLHGFATKFSRVTIKEKVLFSRQLSTLINAGLPIIQSLRAVDEQTASKPLKIVIGQVIADVESGMTLANSMAKHPRVFNQVYISLIGAGETSGTLDVALERLSIQQEKDSDLISKIRGALAYPIIVILVMIAVISFMLVKVLPQVQILYAGLPGAHLPLVTRILLAVSHFVIKFWWVVLLVIGVFGFLGTRWARAGFGKQVVDYLKMHMWPIGKLFMKMYMARFSRTATTLVGSGVPLIQMLEITGKAVNNVHIEASIHRAIEKVKGGTALSAAIRNDPSFLPLVPNMLSIGEESGATEKMLEKAAEYYEKEVDNEVKALSTIIEPVLMVILGIAAFTIVAAVLLPIYSLAGQSFVQV